MLAGKEKLGSGGITGPKFTRQREKAGVAFTPPLVMAGLDPAIHVLR